MKKLLTGLALSGLVLLAQAGNREDIAAAMKAGQWSDAQARLEQVLSKHPENAQAHYWMAEALYRQGKLPEAKAQLDEALRLDPSHQFTNNAKALAALQNRLKSVGGSAAPQAQAGQGPAVPAAEVRTEPKAPAARDTAAPAEKKSGPSWFTWLLIGGAIIGLAMWFTRRTVKDAKEDERKELTAQLEASLNDIRDASRAVDSRADLPVEARFAMSDRARTCEQQLVAELARIKTREEFSTTRELVAQARDVAADLRGQERPSERAARLREAELQAQAQRGMGYGQPGYGQPGYGPGYGQPGYAPQGPGMGGVIAGAALGAVAGMAVGSAMASDSHSASHSGGSSSGGGQGYQPFDAEPPLDLSGGSSSNWDTGSSSSSNWDSGSSSSDSWSTDSSSSDIDFGGGGGDDWS